MSCGHVNGRHRRAFPNRRGAVQIADNVYRSLYRLSVVVCGASALRRHFGLLPRWGRHSHNEVWPVSTTMQVIRAHGCSSRSVASGNSSGSSVRRPIRGGEQLLGSSNGGHMSGLQERSTISKVSHICRVAMESPADGAAAAPGAWAVPDAATTDKRAHCASAAAEPRTEFDVLGIGQVMVRSALHR